MITPNTAAKAAILKNEGDSKNKKEVKMSNHVLFNKSNLSDFPTIVLEHISSTLANEGIGYTSFDGICLILDRSPEFITIHTCEC